MAITIKKSNGQVIPISDSIINRTYSTSLLGEVSEGYGAAVAQSLYQLNENYASFRPPEENPFVNYNNISNDIAGSVRPVTGQLWYDTSTEKLKVYNETEGIIESGWTEVSPDSTTISLVPSRDGDLDIGSTEKYWHSLYATHIHANTNRFDGQIGVADPDREAAVSINGDMVLVNNSSVSDVIISTSEGSHGEIGDVGNPFDTITVEYLRLGDRDESGLRAHPYDETTIIPSSKDDDTGIVDVKLGSDNNSFAGFVANTAYVDVMRGIGEDRNTTISSGTKILPEFDDDLNIASEAVRIKRTYVSNAVIDNLLPMDSFEVDDTVALSLYSDGFRQSDEGTYANTDVVDVESEAGVLKQVPYTNLLPIGFVIMWGLPIDLIPYGWAICDGMSYTNGVPTNNGEIETPDLSDRFVIGVGDINDIGVSGTTNNIDVGSETISVKTTTAAGGHDHGGITAPHQLTIDQIPSHTHSYLQGVGGNSTNGEGGSNIRYGNKGYISSETGGDGAHTHDIDNEQNHTHDYDPSSHSHKVNLEEAKLYKLVYIMKVL